MTISFEPVEIEQHNLYENDLFFCKESNGAIKILIA